MKSAGLTSIILIFFSLIGCQRNNSIGRQYENRIQSDSLHVYTGISLSEYSYIIINLDVFGNYFNGSNLPELSIIEASLDQYIKLFGNPEYGTIDTLRFGMSCNYRDDYRELKYYYPYYKTNLLHLLRKICYVEILTAYWNYNDEKLLSGYFVRVKPDGKYKTIAWSETDFSESEWYKPYYVLKFKYKLPEEINIILGQPVNISSEIIKNGIIPHDTFLLQSISFDRNTLDKSIDKIYIYDWKIDDNHTLRMCYIKNEEGEFEAIGGAQADNYILQNLWE